MMIMGDDRTSSTRSMGTADDNPVVIGSIVLV